MEWVPIGEQENFLPLKPRPVQDDILLAKLRPGQEIECELYCTLGKGAEHAKWQPVCPVYYKLVPEVRLTRKLVKEEA